MKLRWYQQESIDSILSHFESSKSNPCVVLPTGAGKTIVIAELLRFLKNQYRGIRCLCLAHVKELVEQNYLKFLTHWPQAEVLTGVFSASLRRKQLDKCITFASIQSIYKKAMQLGSIDLIIIDEAHRVPVGGEGQYLQFLDECRRINPNVKIVGLSATPYRLGTGVVVSEENVLNEIIYEAPIHRLVEDGFLTRPVNSISSSKADTTSVKKSGGEFIQRQLQAVTNIDELVDVQVDEILNECFDRKHWLLFCVGIEHAENVAEKLELRGIRCAVLHSKISHKERSEIIADYALSKYRALLNVNILAEGFDETRIDAVIMLRPTESAGLYYQMVGRGLRLHPGKDNVLVLDFAGNIAKHGPINDINPKSFTKGSGKAPTKMCPECNSEVLIVTKICPVCSHEFKSEFNDSKYKTSAEKEIEVLKELKPPIDFKVGEVHYNIHCKANNPISLRVTYYEELEDVGNLSLIKAEKYNEWICLEHEGFARRKAVNWVRNRLKEYSKDWMDKTVEELCSEDFFDGLKKPVSIKIDKNKKWPEIVGYEF